MSERELDRIIATMQNTNSKSVPFLINSLTKEKGICNEKEERVKEIKKGLSTIANVHLQYQKADPAEFRQILEMVHSKEYLEFIEQTSTNFLEDEYIMQHAFLPEGIESDTPLIGGIFEQAHESAITAFCAAKDIISGNKITYGLCRPPGHHAGKAFLGGDLMEMDCCFTQDHNWFRYRAAAIIIEDGCVLLVGNETANYFYSVGGGVKIGETAEDAVMREVFEETGVKYEIERLVFIHENFFPGGKGIFSKINICHEIAFYFLMKSRGTQETNSNSYCPEGKEFIKWIPISKLRSYKAFPTFFADKLTNLPNHVEHIVTNEITP